MVLNIKEKCWNQMAVPSMNITKINANRIVLQPPRDGYLLNQQCHPLRTEMAWGLLLE